MPPRASGARSSASLGRIYKNGARSNSKFLYVLIPSGVVFSLLAGFCLPISYVGHPKTPHPLLNSVFFAMFPIGLLFTAVGHRMSRGEWKGVSKELHARIALTSLAFVLTTIRYVLNGKSVDFYPAGVLLMISAIFILSRLFMKFIAREHYRWG